MSFFYARMTTDMKLAHIQTVSKPIERLIPHPQNPNTHDDRQIVKRMISIIWFVIVIIVIALLSQKREKKKRLIMECL